MTEYNANVLFPHQSGIVESLQNDLTLKGSSSGNVIVGQFNNLRPEIDSSQTLGEQALRWANIFTAQLTSTTGSFTDLVVSNTSQLNTVEFAGVTTVNETIGALGPGLSGSNILGTATRPAFSTDIETEWLPFRAVAANSGVFGALRGLPSDQNRMFAYSNIVPFNPVLTPGSNPTTTTRVIGLGTDGAPWTYVYSISGVFDGVNASQGVDTVNLDVTNTATISVADIDGMTVAGEAEFEASSNVDFEGDVNFNDGGNIVAFNNIRPRLNGSGIAVREEIIHFERAQLVNLNPGQANGVLQVDGTVTNSFFAVPILERSRVYPKFTISALHIHASQPSPWQFLIRKVRTNNTRVDAASGVFFWSASAVTNFITVNKMTLDATESIFEEGERMELWAHNDGSGTVVDNISFQLQFGFTRHTATSGIEV